MNLTSVIILALIIVGAIAATRYNIKNGMCGSEGHKCSGGDCSHCIYAQSESEHRSKNEK